MTIEYRDATAGDVFKTHHSFHIYQDATAISGNTVQVKVQVADFISKNANDLSAAVDAQDLYDLGHAYPGTASSQIIPFYEQNDSSLDDASGNTVDVMYLEHRNNPQDTTQLVKTYHIYHDADGDSIAEQIQVADFTNKNVNDISGASVAEDLYDASLANAGAPSSQIIPFIEHDNASPLDDANGNTVDVMYLEHRNPSDVTKLVKTYHIYHDADGDSIAEQIQVADFTNKDENDISGASVAEDLYDWNSNTPFDQIIPFEMRFDFNTPSKPGMTSTEGFKMDASWQIHSLTERDSAIIENTKKTFYLHHDADGDAPTSSSSG